MPQTVSVNIAVPGKFHVLNYAKYIAEKGELAALYMSHKPETPRAYGLPDDKVENYPAKEYLTQLHGRILKDFAYELMQPVYFKLWEKSAIKHFRPAGILHLISQGAGVQLVRTAHDRGSKVICEAVNTHPENRLEVIAGETERWELGTPRKALYGREKGQIEEAHAADLLLTPSSIVAQSYRSRGVLTEVRKIPYAANVQRFKPQPRSSAPRGEPLKVICVGRIGLRKGQLYLLEAARALGRTVALTLVGTVDPLLYRHLQRHADSFQHFERVPHADMPDLLARHDVFVCPSLEEGLAVSICEAMAMGLCVIATEESGATEILEHSVSGYIVASRSVDALSEALQALAVDRELTRSVGEAAIHRARETVNWQSYSKRLSDIYAELLS